MSDFSTRKKLDRQLTPDDPIVIDRSPLFFAFDGVDMHYFEDIAAAQEFAENALNEYAEEASSSDGWDDTAFHISYGIVSSDVQTTARRDIAPEERKDTDDNIEWFEERELTPRNVWIDPPAKSSRKMPPADTSNDPLVCELTIEQLREKADRSHNTGEFYDGY